MRNFIDEAIGASPAARIDVEEVIATGRRRTRQRRLLLVSPAIGSAAAVVAVVALTASTVGPSPGPSGPSAAQPASPTVPSGVAPVRPGETPEQASQRLAEVLTDRLTAALPGVVLTEWFGGQPGVLVYHEAEAGGRFSSGTVVTVGSSQNQVDMVSWPNGRLPEPVAPTDWPTDAPAPPRAASGWLESCADTVGTFYAQAECADSTGPDGQRVVTLTIRCIDGEECEIGAVTGYSAWVTWTNAKVQVSVTAGTKRGGPAPPGVPPMLTLEQLIAIATDPDLTVAT